MPLTDTQVRNAKPKTAPYKLTDAEGMYLLVNPSGARYWRLKYRYGGKEKVLALGVYPDVRLPDARRRRADAKALIAQNRDPGFERKTEKVVAAFRTSNTFEGVAREWWETQRSVWSDSHATGTLQRLEKQLFPALSGRPISEIEAPELLTVLRIIEARGALELASKTLITAGQVFRYAIATSRAKSDPTRDLRGALKRREVHHYNALKESELPEFLKKLDAYDGHDLTRHAMRLLMLTFLRTNELRGARWTEFDFNKAEWRVPAERMKSRAEHLVPLCTQSIAVLEQIKTLSGNREHVFPNEHNPQKCMSENTILFALYRMGYRGRATGHGFRATASTILNEQGWRADVIERQLAHTEKNKVRAAYHRSQYLDERRRMMQGWADYLDRVKVEAKVIPLRGNAA